MSVIIREMGDLIDPRIFDSPINLDLIKHHIDSLPALSIMHQGIVLNIVLMRIKDKPSHIKKVIVKMLIDSKRIDFKNVLKQRNWLCNFTTTEYILRDESVSASMRSEPELLKRCNDAILEYKTQKIKDLRIIMPADKEVPSVDKVIRVPVYNIDKSTYPKKQISVKIVEIGDCQFEMTEAVVSKFYNKLEDLKQDTHIKEVLHYSFPSIFPTDAPIAAISDENPLKSKIAQWEQLKLLNDPRMDIMTRRAKLVELSNIIDTIDILELVRLSYDMIKPSQIVKVEFNHDTFGYYVLHNCSIHSPVNIAEDYVIMDTDTEIFISPVTPQIHNVRGMDVVKSELPTLYSLPQIAAINSWITHGLLSVFLMRRDFLKSICTNPLIGNEDFWGYIQHMMQTQFSILYSASKPLAADTLLYRGSPHFKDHPVRMRTVIATSKQQNFANQFNVPGYLAKKVIVPAGTHVIDLSTINIQEEEVLIFPSGDSNLLIEPVELLRNKTKRNTYRIRNINKAGGGGKRRRKTYRK